MATGLLQAAFNAGPRGSLVAIAILVLGVLLSRQRMPTPTLSLPSCNPGSNTYNAPELFSANEVDAVAFVMSFPSAPDPDMVKFVRNYRKVCDAYGIRIVFVLTNLQHCVQYRANSSSTVEECAELFASPEYLDISLEDLVVLDETKFSPTAAKNLPLSLYEMYESIGVFVQPDRMLRLVRTLSDRSYEHRHPVQ